jgi:hypothetical protein
MQMESALLKSTFNPKNESEKDVGDTLHSEASCSQ